jgi:glyoxalase family protein
VSERRRSRSPWLDGGVREDAAIRGLHSVTLTVRSPHESIDFLTSVLGSARRDEAGHRTRLAVATTRPGQLARTGARARCAGGAQRPGHVHHVALAISCRGDQRRYARI